MHRMIGRMFQTTRIGLCCKNNCAIFARVVIEMPVAIPHWSSSNRRDRAGLVHVEAQLALGQARLLFAVASRPKTTNEAALLAAAPRLSNTGWPIKRA